ncbi:MAG: hypothetical protein ACPGJV_04120 [Bacteriovoracaceae bacterium]
MALRVFIATFLMLICVDASFAKQKKSWRSVLRKADDLRNDGKNFKAARLYELILRKKFKTKVDDVLHYDSAPTLSETLEEIIVNLTECYVDILETPKLSKADTQMYLKRYKRGLKILRRAGLRDDYDDLFGEERNFKEKLKSFSYHSSHSMHYGSYYWKDQVTLSDGRDSSVLKGNLKGSALSYNFHYTNIRNSFRIGIDYISSQGTMGNINQNDSLVYTLKDTPATSFLITLGYQRMLVTESSRLGLSIPYLYRSITMQKPDSSITFDGETLSSFGYLVDYSFMMTKKVELRTSIGSLFEFSGALWSVLIGYHF